jgi:aminoglycoside 6'-N-acetyltransferase I
VTLSAPLPPAATVTDGLAVRSSESLSNARWQYHGPVSQPFHMRPSASGDVDVVSQLFFALWPETSLDEHRAEAALRVTGNPPSTMPLVVLVAEVEGVVVGFVEVGLRSHADGCDGRRPVAFMEGWYVDPEHQRHGIGRALVGVAEEWARSHGCDEIASDTWIDREPSQRAHDALGFEVVDRCVHYRKSLR